MKLILNELSLKILAENKEKAYQAMEQIANILQNVNTLLNKATRILTHNPFKEQSLTEDYSLNLIQWFKNAPLDKDTKRIVLNAFAQEPMFRDIPPFYFFQEDDCLSFGYAFENDWAIINYDVKNTWILNDYEVQRIEDENEELIEVRNITTFENLKYWEEWLKERQTQEDNSKIISITSPAIFWKIKDNLLPNLEFCDAVEKQIESISIQLLQSSISKLLTLNNYIENLSVNYLDTSNLPFKASEESESTLNKYSKERTFRCSDGIDRVFSWHIKFLGRIHFYPIPNSKKCWIGYIGKHLSTSKYN